MKGGKPLCKMKYHIKSNGLFFREIDANGVTIKFGHSGQAKVFRSRKAAFSMKKKLEELSGQSFDLVPVKPAP